MSLNIIFSHPVSEYGSQVEKEILSYLRKKFPKDIVINPFAKLGNDPDPIKYKKLIRDADLIVIKETDFNLDKQVYLDAKSKLDRGYTTYGVRKIGKTFLLFQVFYLLRDKYTEEYAKVCPCKDHWCL